MAKIESQLIAVKPEEQLLSKQAIQLPPKERLQLLLSAKSYPTVKKRTSAEAQIKEMLDFYKFCCLMLVNYFPNEKAERNYIALVGIELALGQQTVNQPISKQLSKEFELVENYEEFDKKITAIQNLFWQYSYDFPEIFDKYNLEDIATERIHEMLENARYMLESNPSGVERILKRWELL